VGSDISELSLTIGDNGTSTSTISLPIPEETEYTDYVTVRSTNAGVHHAFSTTGNYYYGNSIVPDYTSLPVLTTLQIGGSASASFGSSTYYSSGYQYIQVSLPEGYFLCQAYLDLTPTSTNQYIQFGLSFETNAFDNNLNQYHTFANTSRTFYQLNTYVSQDNNVNYNFLFYSNSGVMMTKGKCTFIRIA